MKFNESLNYYSAGEGFPILFIHGFPLSHRIWQPQIEFLSKSGFKVIAPDLPGFGDSLLDTDSVSLDYYSAKLKELIDALQLKKIILAGMSMGGYTAFNFISKFSNYVEKLILIATKAGADDEKGKQRRTELIEMCKASGTKPVIDIFTKILWDDETFISSPELIKNVEKEMQKAIVEGVIGGLTAMRERKDYTSELDKITCPTLILHSIKDKAVTFENAEITNKGIKNSKLIKYEKGGHMINMEIADLVNNDILKFFED